MVFSKEQTATNLRALRTLRNLSQRDLADVSGVSYESIKGYESGKSVMSLENAAKIADALDCSVDALVIELQITA
ncbi:MAG: helix-turn-helix transcriptional regulator [Atopobiaceae bacterium]|nr:helix-turn-helix transcriptional regulator [Atopobiaceae bacterium]